MEIAAVKEAHNAFIGFVLSKKHSVPLVEKKKEQCQGDRFRMNVRDSLYVTESKSGIKGLGKSS